MKKISVIIPVYNGADTIEKCLLSIFNQNVNEDIEVIAVNDCSKDNTLDVLNSIKSRYPNDLIVVDLPENHKVGGARKAGIEYATGTYLQYLDADDWLVDGALPKLLKELNVNPDLDMLFYESLTIEEGSNKLLRGIAFGNNNLDVLNGEDYITTQQIPWTAWCALYNHEFLKKNKIEYADHVRFEDVDDVLKSILLANSIKYAPIPVLYHVVSGNSTTNIGNDKEKIDERLQCADRIYNVIEELKNTHARGVDVVKGHYKYMYHAIMLRNVWRLDYNSIIELLKAHPYYEAECNDKLINLTQNHPHVYAGLSAIFGPIMKLLLKIHKKLK